MLITTQLGECNMTKANNNDLPLRWLEERQTYLGGSDIGAVVGVNSYRTPLDIYLSKVGGLPQTELSEAAAWGSRLEEVIAEVYAEKTGKLVSKEQNFIRHKDYTFLAANIDRWVGEREYILECKTAGFMMSKEWGGAEYTEEIPPVYYAQVAWYAAICNVCRVDIAVLIGGQDFRIYTYNKDPKFEANLIQAGINFWRNHVEKKIPPSAVNVDDLKVLFPEGKDKAIFASNEINQIIQELKELRAQEKELGVKIDTLKFRIQNFMQEHDTLLDRNGKKLASWKTSAPSKKVDLEMMKTNYPEVFEACLKTSKSSRMFLYQFSDSAVKAKVSALEEV